MKSQGKNRSETMRQVKSSNTTPEKMVRRLLTNSGFRYQLNAVDLPGKPDIVFRGKKKVIFINGCFWHGHSCKRGDRIPRTNTDYWQNKIAKNKSRDEAVARTLTAKGWESLTIWECEIKDEKKISQKILNFLDGPSLNC